VRSYFYALIAAIIIIIATIVVLNYESDPSGAAVHPVDESGIFCCTFEFNGEVKTCAAPAGQTCDACNGVCTERLN
jgi:hypothetical protein